MEPTINFCSSCGAPVSFRVPDGDSLPRHVCDRCGVIHYRNPKLVVGSLPVWEDRVLLCRRAIEPRYGKWTLPAGFMENGETTAEAAARETWEEACSRVEVDELFAVFNLPQINQVYMMFRAHLPVLEFAPGVESLECKLYYEHEIPWAELAFPTITHTLKRYFQDRAQGRFGLHFGDIVRDGHHAEFVPRRPRP